MSLGAAIAAGSVLVVRSWSAAPHRAGRRARCEQPSEPPQLRSRRAPRRRAFRRARRGDEEQPKPPPATIESVDFGSNAGEVFVVSTDSSETPVVWMPDDAEPDEDNEDRSESL